LGNLGVVELGASEGSCSMLLAAGKVMGVKSMGLAVRQT
jgi:hypothetical protein